MMKTHCPNCNEEFEAYPEVEFSRTAVRPKEVAIEDFVSIRVSICLDGVRHTSEQSFNKRIGLDYCETITQRIMDEVSHEVFDKARKKEEKTSAMVQQAAKKAEELNYRKVFGGV